MINGQEVSEKIAELAFRDANFSSDQMKRLVYSILKNADDTAKRGDFALSKGLMHCVRMLLSTIYDIDEQEDGRIFNDATWEIFNRRGVTCKEIAAFCMTAFKYMDGVIESELPLKDEYAHGWLVAVCAIVDIVEEETAI